MIAAVRWTRAFAAVIALAVVSSAAGSRTSDVDTRSDRCGPATRSPPRARPDTAGFARAVATLSSDAVIALVAQALYRSDVNDTTDYTAENDYDRAARVALTAAALALANGSQP